MMTRDRKMWFFLLLAVLFSLFSFLPVYAIEQKQSIDAQELWIDLRIGPPLIDVFNEVAVKGDIARIDHPNQIMQLKALENGRKMIIFKSLAEAKQALPGVAEEIDIIGYNLEHTPGTPESDQADPLASVEAMRELADEYDLDLAFGPDHDFALSHGVEIAPFADIFVLQIQRQQTNPRTVAGFVEPLVPELKEANPDLEVSVQVRTEGDVQEIIDLIESLDANLDGVSILTSPDTADVAEEWMRELRPAPSFMQDIGDNGGRMFIGVVVIALILVGWVYWRWKAESK